MVRVAVTTSVDAEPRLSHVLRARGFDPIALPCIEIMPADHDELDRLRVAAAAADWIVLASPRAITAVWPEGWMPSTPAACVGPTTAACCEAAGGYPALVGSGGAEALVDALGVHLETDVVVFPHASATDPNVIDRLAQMCQLTHGIAYRTAILAPADAPVDAVVFTSPSTVRGWLSARSLDGLVIAALGSSTANELRVHGHEPQVIPTSPNVEELADALARHCETRKWND
ncbi:MAG: uroporphyrinogen-III synthase [Acidimicrobiia bacterium]